MLNNENIKIYELVEKAEENLQSIYNSINKVSFINTQKVLKAFNKNRISTRHFSPTNGYGYDDVGRDTLEKLFSDIMHTQATMLRPQIVSGTHALSLCLFGLLRSGDHLLSASGSPYDTLHTVIGCDTKVDGSLCEMGVEYSETDLTKNGEIDIDAVKTSLQPNTKVVMVQRSRGYSTRRSILPSEIEDLSNMLKIVSPNTVLMVDNCYGEFVCVDEPSDFGADVIVGSMIKNPGGGLAPTGGYISGKKELIDIIATRLTCPGIGLEIGSYEASYRPYYQGIFMAPHVVAQALKLACLSREVFNMLGIKSYPEHDENRSDIVQAIVMKNPERVISFCKGIQYASPIDSFAAPTPWDMPGYAHKVIMAAGTFVSGASIEISADGPIREPYIVYLQGCLTYEHGKIAFINAINTMIEDKCL